MSERVESNRPISFPEPQQMREDANRALKEFQDKYMVPIPPTIRDAMNNTKVQITRLQERMNGMCLAVIAMHPGENLDPAIYGNVDWQISEGGTFLIPQPERLPAPIPTGQIPRSEPAIHGGGRP